jgi:cbb3-type cytochrome oxidase cytochrome c subunit
VVEHFVEPQKLSPGSTMPPYKFNPKDMSAITDYLMGLM